MNKTKANPCETCGEKNCRGGGRHRDAEEVYLLRQAGFVMPPWWSPGMMAPNTVPYPGGDMPPARPLVEVADMLSATSPADWSIDQWAWSREALVTELVLAGTSNHPAQVQGWKRGRAAEAVTRWRAAEERGERGFPATYSIGGDSYSVRVVWVTPSGLSLDVEGQGSGRWSLSPTTGVWTAGKRSGSLLLGIGLVRLRMEF